MTNDHTSPRQALIDMAQGYFRGKTLCAAARLGIAEVLGDDEMSVDDLSAATDSDGDALYRLLRALASIGILAEVAPERFALTPLGQPLRRDAPDSVWASVIFWSDLLADSWTYLAECVRDGETDGAFAVMDREDVPSRWSLDPDAQAIFRAVFAEPDMDEMAMLAAAYDFSTSRVVADLGGANGALLSAILEANPSARGILVDRSESIDDAASRIADAGLAGRCDLVAEDLLDAVPEGADVYIMKAVLHGYDDDDAQRILENCHAAMEPEGRLLIIEAVLPARVDRVDPQLERMLMADLNMLVVTGGQERRASDWEALLSSAGFDIQRVLPVGGQDAGIIEASPRG